MHTALVKCFLPVCKQPLTRDPLTPYTRSSRGATSDEHWSVSMHAHTHTRTHTQTHSHTHSHTHTYTHTHTHTLCHTDTSYITGQSSFIPHNHTDHTSTPLTRHSTHSHAPVLSTISGSCVVSYLRLISGLLGYSV